MAPHAGTAGLKVLLAGQSQEDLSGAQTFLAGEGAIGVYLQMNGVFGVTSQQQADEASTLHPLQ